MHDYDHKIVLAPKMKIRRCDGCNETWDSRQANVQRFSRYRDRTLMFCCRSCSNSYFDRERYFQRSL